MPVAPLPRLVRTVPAEEPCRSWAEATDLLRLVAEISLNIARRKAVREGSALEKPSQVGGAASRSDNEADGDAMTAISTGSTGGVR